MPTISHTPTHARYHLQLPPSKKREKIHKDLPVDQKIEQFAENKFKTEHVHHSKKHKNPFAKNHSDRQWTYQRSKNHQAPFVSLKGGSEILPRKDLNRRVTRNERDQNLIYDRSLFGVRPYNFEF